MKSIHSPQVIGRFAIRNGSNHTLWRGRSLSKLKESSSLAPISIRPPSIVVHCDGDGGVDVGAPCGILSS